MKRMICTAVIGLFVVSLAGCNTIRGVGQDMQKAGEKIEDAAKRK